LIVVQQSGRVLPACLPRNTTQEKKKKKKKKERRSMLREAFFLIAICFWHPKNLNNFRWEVTLKHHSSYSTL
jgi:hypothetical protein